MYKIVPIPAAKNKVIIGSRRNWRMATKVIIEITQLEADWIEDGKIPQIAAVISATTAGLIPVKAACTACKRLYFIKKKLKSELPAVKESLHLKLLPWNLRPQPFYNRQKLLH